MSIRNFAIVVAAAALTLPASSGCNSVTTLLSGNVVTVEVVNDTPFDVDPRLVTSEESGFFGGLFGNDSDLATGIVAPGDAISLDLDCDSFATIFCDAAEQLDGNDLVGAVQPTKRFEIDQDFECGDVIRFRFVGSESSFGVQVSVNGAIVPD